MGNAIFSASSEDDVLRAVLLSVADAKPRPLLPTSSGRKGGWTLPGFGPKTRITTAFGDLPIEALRLRDDIRTSTGRMLRVACIEQIRLDAEYLRNQPDAQPILLRQDALDHGKPGRDMLVSPRQELSHGLANFQKRFAPADRIKGRPNVSRLPQTAITYFLFHCGEPAIVLAEGVPARIAPLEAPTPE